LGGEKLVQYSGAAGVLAGREDTNSLHGDGYVVLLPGVGAIDDDAIGRVKAVGGNKTTAVLRYCLSGGVGDSHGPGAQVVDYLAARLGPTGQKGLVPQVSHGCREEGAGQAQHAAPAGRVDEGSHTTVVDRDASVRRHGGDTA
jgi:hypothetical protein